MDFPHVDGVTHRYVETSRLRVHLAEAGPEDAEPMLLLHGWPQHWYEWRGLVPLLSERYRLLMPDLRGLGWSEYTESGYEKENLARDQFALLDALGLDRVKLIGHDWGGYAGFLMCLMAPQRVEKFMPLNIAHPWPKPDARGLLNIWRLAYQLPLAAPLLGPRITRIPGVLKFAIGFSQRDAFSDEELEAFEAPLRDPQRSPATAKYYRSFQLHDLPLLVRGHWRQYRLTTPTLLLLGKGDPVIAEQTVSGFEPYADDMRVELGPATGHFIADVAPDFVARRALEFFEAR